MSGSVEDGGGAGGRAAQTGQRPKLSSRGHDSEINHILLNKNSPSGSQRSSVFLSSDPHYTMTVTRSNKETVTTDIIFLLSS